MIVRAAIALSLLLLAHAAPAVADGFAALVSPPRFELKAKAHSTVREVIEITNRAASPSRLRIHTEDLSLRPDYGVVFRDDLAPAPQ